MNDYIKYVREHPDRVGRLTRLAVERHISDISRSDIYFDSAAAARAVAFVRLCRHTKGKSAGQKFNMQPWQEFIIGSIFGWMRKSGLRRFTKAYVQVARKNGKSELVAPIGLYMGAIDGEAGAEVYSAATTKDQARLVFDAAAKMSDNLRKDSKIYAKAVESSQRHKIIGKETLIRPVASDSDTLDGLNPHLAIIDEFHAHKNDGIPEVMISGMVARSQPLLFYITTAGFSIASPCYELRKLCASILTGEKEDDSMFCIMFEPDDDDEWHDEAIWCKANPNLGISVSLEAMRDEARDAKNKGASKQAKFQVKNLNMWLNVSKGWLDAKRWANLAARRNLADMAGRECYGGLDMASVRDLTAFSLFFPAQNENEKPYLCTFLWAPEETAKDRHMVDQVPYLNWASEGHIKLTEGNAIDSEVIKLEIMAIIAQVNCVSIAKDRAYSAHVTIGLSQEGVALSDFGQGFISMNTPCKEYERMILDGSLEHDGSPCMLWQFSNLEPQYDASGNLKFSKSASKEKIDGHIANVMAIGEYLTEENNPKSKSPYSSGRGALVIRRR